MTQSFLKMTAQGYKNIMRERKNVQKQKTRPDCIV